MRQSPARTTNIAGAIATAAVRPTQGMPALISTLMLACVTGCFQPADAASRRPAQPPTLRSCIVPTPEPIAIFAQTSKSDEGDDDEDEEDDEDEDDEDEAEEAFDEDAVRGWLAPDGVTCIAFGGSVSAGASADVRSMPKSKAGRLRSQDVATFPVTGIMKFDAVSRPDGWTVATGLTIAMRSGSDPSLDRATVSIGSLTAGRDVSTFVFFDGADFAFSARTPARQATMLANRLQLTDSLSLTTSIENPPDAATALAQGLTNPTGARWPDLVARALYEGDTLTLHAAGALRELRRADGGPTRLASAFLLGASREFQIGGITHTLLAQAGGTRGAPVYIGSQLDSTDALSLLTGQEVTNGWSGLVSLTSDWTQTVSTSAYASRYALRIPNRTNAAGHIDISRFAANMVWKPAQMVKVGVEIGWSHSDITLPRLAMTGVETHRTSISFWLQKSF